MGLRVLLRRASEARCSGRSRAALAPLQRLELKRRELEIVPPIGCATIDTGFAWRTASRDALAERPAFEPMADMREIGRRKKVRQSTPGDGARKSVVGGFSLTKPGQDGLGLGKSFSFLFRGLD